MCCVILPLLQDFLWLGVPEPFLTKLQSPFDLEIFFAEKGGDSIRVHVDGLTNPHKAALLVKHLVDMAGVDNSKWDYIDVSANHHCWHYACGRVSLSVRAHMLLICVAECRERSVFKVTKALWAPSWLHPWG